MGGTSSTRKITVASDEATGVIKISDTVVKRLRGEVEQGATRKAGLTETVNKETLESSITAPSKRASTTPYEDLRVQALRLNQEREENVRSLEAHWKAKVNAAEEQNVAIQKRMVGEFGVAVDEVGKLFPTRTCEPICTEKQEKVQNCYETNSKTSLKCSKEVRDFTECVQQARLETLIRG